MTKQEFITYLDGFNKDCGEFTDAEMYEIGCKYKELPVSEKDWSWLASKLGPVDKNNNPKSGETFRIWIKSRQYADGSIKKNVQLLSGQTIHDLNFEDAEAKLNEIKEDIYKKTTIYRDERNALNRDLRYEARYEDMQKKICEQVKDMPPIQIVEKTYDSDEGTEAVLLFSDLHIGAIVDNFFNKYDEDIAIKRVTKLVNDVVYICERNNVQKLNFCALGDNIHGAIHNEPRVECREDRARELMVATEIIAQALAKLSESVPHVVYRSVFGNHDRMTANLKESLDNESFCRIMDWYLKERLASSSVEFADDNLDGNTGMFELDNGKTVVFVHGHLDKDFTKSVLGFSAALSKKIDYFLLGHYHSASVKPIQGTTVITNGSIMGVDQFATSVRLFGPATQTLLVFDGGDNVMNITIDLQKAK